MKLTHLLWIYFLAASVVTGSLHAQAGGGLQIIVSYVTSSQVYFDAGNDEGVILGDTVVIGRGDTLVGRATISALSSHSSVGKIERNVLEIKIGDTGTIARIAVPRSNEHSPGESVGSIGYSSQKQQKENVISGRVAVYWSGIFADNSRLNVSQPAALGSLRFQNLSGTGMTLSLSGREYYDLSSNYLRYGDSVRSHLDMYEMKLERDRPDEVFGFGVGRMNSRFIAGLGTFDGGQVFIRQGNFTAGVVYGKGIGDRALDFGGHDVKNALFVGYHQLEDGGLTYEGSIAYGRLMLDNKIDREFLSLQNDLSVNTELTIMGNAELDMRTLNQGQPESAFRLSNIFVFANYLPKPWLYASVGYDGTRPITLLESSRGLTDSLLHDALMHGLRASVTARVWNGLSLTGSASFRSQPGDPRSSHSLTGMARLFDVLGTRANGSLRYSAITGPSFDAHDLTCGIDRQIVSSISLLLKYDLYNVSVLPLKQSYRTQTYSAQIDWRPVLPFFAGIGGGYIIDNTVNSITMFFQAGMRF